MPISGGSNDGGRSNKVEVVELHWMKESDLAMNASSGVAAPALCGAWVDPDPLLTASVGRREVEVRYVSCTQCDLLADLRTDAVSA